MSIVGPLCSTQAPGSRHPQAQAGLAETHPGGWSSDHQQLGWGVAGLGETRVTSWGLGMPQQGLGVTSPHLPKLIALFKVCVPCMWSLQLKPRSELTTNRLCELG